MFDGNKLGELPKQSELHHLADYLELLCLTDRDREYAVGRLADKLVFAADLQETSPDAQDGDEPDVIDAILGEESTEDVDVALAFEILTEAHAAELHSAEATSTPTTPQDGDDEEAADREAYEIYGRDAEVRDERTRWCEDLFAHILYRAEIVGDSYPFDVSEDAQTLILRRPSPERLFYVYLLMCSSLRYLPKKTRSKFTTSFELLAADVLMAILPDRAVVDVFGTARGVGVSQIVGNSLYKRIGKLAKALGGKRHVSRKDFHPKDTADNGLDIVGWIPLPGGREGVLSFFGQCACGTGWRGKQHEADYLMRWKNYITLVSPPATLTFIPYFFRKPGGYWYAASAIDTVVFDRLRIFLLAQESKVAMRQEAFELAHEAWMTSTAQT